MNSCFHFINQNSIIKNGFHIGINREHELQTFFICIFPCWYKDLSTRLVKENVVHIDIYRNT